MNPEGKKDVRPFSSSWVLHFMHFIQRGLNASIFIAFKIFTKNNPLTIFILFKGFYAEYESLTSFNCIKTFSIRSTFLFS